MRKDNVNDWGLGVSVCEWLMNRLYISEGFCEFIDKTVINWLVFVDVSSFEVWIDSTVEKDWGFVRIGRWVLENCSSDSYDLVIDAFDMW